jgi:hypothetical protein
MRKFYSIIFLLVSIASQNETVVNNTNQGEQQALNLTEELEKQVFNATVDEKVKMYYENLDKVAPKAKEKTEEQKQLEEIEAREWEEKIHNFYPDNLITMSLEPGQNEFLYEDIDIVPNKIFIASYVHDEEERVDFEISYNKTIIEKVKNKNKFYFEFDVDKAGTYTFVIRNDRVYNCLILV